MPSLGALLVSGSMMLPTQALPDLQHTEWRLQSPAQPAPLPTLSIADSRIGGFAGCNRFTLGVDGEGRHQVSTTRMQCAPETMAREQALLKLLGAPFRLLPSTDRRHLTLASGKAVYRFEKVDAAPPAAAPLATLQPGRASNTGTRRAGPARTAPACACAAARASRGATTTARSPASLPRPAAATT
ncbi:META domain-containing protein [Chromobacterium violaceum]|uniref:META domain n=1 Tax=Chromobacterium violaceum TaxID=536 RepID=A0AAX2ME60_CHRVL|nr:META domain-containing protein [Chromobacterium violaceum]SUX34929.1 META domain [Chromobacterium violaceum]